MAASDADLNKLAKKLLDALAQQSSMQGPSMGGTASSRLGRGGDSNGIGSMFNSAKDALGESSKDVNKSFRNLGKTSDVVVDSFKKMTKFNYIFGENMKDTTKKILDSHKVYTQTTEKIVKATQKQAAAVGVNAVSLHKAARANFNYADSVNKVVQLQRKLVEVDNAKIAQAQVETELNKKSNRSNKAKMALLEDELRALKSITANEQDYRQELTKTETALKEMGKNILENNVAFGELSDSTKKNIKTNNFLNLSQRRQDEIIRELRENSEDYADTLIKLNKETANQHALLKDKMNKVMSSMADSMRALGGSMGGIIDNFRSQLQYNVRESNYLTAGRTGMSEGQMSKFLGSNADTIRGMTGGSNLNTFANGDMTGLHQSVVANYGESGLDGANRIAQLANIMQASGTNIRNNPNAVQDRISSYSNMSARLGMSKGDLTDLMQSFAQSGDLTQISQKYAGMDPRAQQMAIDKELEARIANAKMLGYSTEQLKQQLAAQKDKQFGNIGDQIRKIVGLKMMDNKMRKDGMGMSSEEMGAMRADVMGANLTPEQQVLVDRVKNRSMDSDNTKRIAGINSFAKSGNYGDMAQSTVQRMILQNFSGNAEMGFSDAEQKDRMARLALSRGRYGSEADAYLRGGGLSGQLTGPGAGPESFNSSLLPFDQSMNAGKTLYDGANANPLMGMAKGIAATAGNTGTMVKQLYGMLGQGMLGGGGKGGALARVGRGAGGAATRGLASVGTAMGAGRLGIASTAGRALVGGIGGLGVGLLGAGASWGGDKLKEQAAAEGLNNNTVFDKDSAGAMLDVGGQAITGAAMGALVGSVIPVLGTAVGGVIGGLIGAGKGAWDNRDTMMRNYDTLYGQKTSSPAERLNASTAEAQKEREANAKPIQVELAGKSAEDLAKTAGNTGAAADATKAVAAETAKGNEYYKSAEDIKGALAAMKDDQKHTTDYYKGLGSA